MIIFFVNVQDCIVFLVSYECFEMSLSLVLYY